MDNQVMVAVVAEDDEAEIRRREALNGIGLALEKWKDEAVVWRAEFESEWTQDYRQYNTASRDHLPPTKRHGSTVEDEAAYRQTSDNITRSKVIITAARLGDMLFPTNDANWTLGVPARPEVPPELIPEPPPTQDEQGNPVPGKYTTATLLEAKRNAAKKAASGMQDEIKDQLGECAYAESGRAAIFDGCLYGSGVLAGPILRNKKKHTYGGRGRPKMVESARPNVEHVDLWSFFPQPCRSIEEAEHAFRLHLLPRRGVRKLADEPGFDRRQIAELLKLAPAHGALATSALQRGTVRPDSDVTLSGRYSVWQFRGPMPKEAFAAFVEGLVLQGLFDPEDAGEIATELERDPMNEIDCEVWFAQGIVIKMAMSTLARGELGYYVFNYEKDPNSIFGRGVAFLCRDDQHATNQLWHAMMLNSMMSAGPQIGVRKGSLVEQGGRATVLSADRPRVWALNDDVQDINHALSVFNVPNVTQHIITLYERSKANADEHTMTPLIAQGEPTSAMPTSSGIAMLMNAANVVMRRLAKTWDDDITIPLIGAFYDWNMEFNKDDSIKGDYCVVPRGASHLLIKDVQAQHVQFATQLFSNNPVLAPYMKPGVFARKNIELLDIPPDEMLFTDDEVAQQQAAKAEQPDPEVLKAQASQATAEAAMERARAESELVKHKIEWEREERKIAHAERMADIAARERIQSMQLQGQKLSILQAMAKMEADERVAMSKIIADLEKSGGMLDLQQYQIDNNVTLEAEKIAKDERQFEREIEVEGEDARVQ